jgi:hypothetical protein
MPSLLSVPSVMQDLSPSPSPQGGGEPPLSVSGRGRGRGPQNPKPPRDRSRRGLPIPSALLLSRKGVPAPAETPGVCSPLSRLPPENPARTRPCMNVILP